MKAVRRIILAVLILTLCMAGMTGTGSAEVNAEETVQNGRITQRTWTDENGTTVAGPEGYATVEFSYSGSNTTERYFDAEGNPYRMPGGYYGRIVTADSRKRITEIVYLDAEGNKALNDMGYARIILNYMSSGDITYVGYYGLGKKRIMVPSLGYACVVTEYSSTEMTRRTYGDVDGNPVDTAEGYAIIRQKLNKLHQVIRTRYEHADGTPALCADGWYLCERERDEKGRILSVKYYDTAERLTDRGAGYAWEGYTYGDGTVTVNRYSLQGEKIPMSGNAVSLLRRMSGDTIAEETWLNEQGEPVNGEKGYCRAVYAYDAAGRLKETRYYDAGGNEITF